MPQFNRSAVVACSIAAVLALSACGHNRPDPYYGGGYGGVYQGAAPAYPVNNNAHGTEFGRVSNIEVLQSRGSGQTSGGGAVLGAVAHRVGTIAWRRGMREGPCPNCRKSRR